MKISTKPKIFLSLDAPDTTNIHRAGMAGLQMSLKQLEKKYPSPDQRGGYITWNSTDDTIQLSWEGSDFAGVSWLLKESFQLDDMGLIQLAGLDNDTTDLRQKIHIHEGICAIFLRHNMFYKAGKRTKTELMVDGKKVRHSYKPLAWYAHQTFAEKLCDIDTQQLRQDYIKITSWLYPGAIVCHAQTGNITKLEEKPEYALALLFLPVICHYFQLHLPSEDFKEKKPGDYLVVIPEINNFEEASQRRWQLQQLETQQLHVGSIGEAGLLYYSRDRIQAETNYHQACQVWLYKKMNQSSHQRTLMNIEEITIDGRTLTTYQQIQQDFQPNYQKIQPYQIFIKVNAIRSLIAENLIQGNYGWSNLWTKLIVEDSEGYLLNQLLYNREGVIKMIEDRNEDERYLIFIRAFQQAMKVYFAKIYEKNNEGKKPNFNKKIDRLRAELSCCYDRLSFQQYLSDFLVRGGLNKYFYENKEELLLLIKNTDWEELRIWAFLAMASYKPNKKGANIDNNSSLNNQDLEGGNDESE